MIITQEHTKPLPNTAPLQPVGMRISFVFQIDIGTERVMHNHPSGDPKPSRDDIEMTREIKAAAGALGISIHDHLVIGRKGHASFRSLGLLT